MAQFQSLNRFYSKKLKVCKALLTSYVILQHQIFLHLDYLLYSGEKCHDTPAAYCDVTRIYEIRLFAFQHHNTYGSTGYSYDQIHATILLERGPDDMI